MVPSARVVNHSGCSVAHGWSGAACRAKSSATSSPSRPASATNASKSSSVPRSGWIASWPPSRLPMAQGEPTSSGVGVSVLFGALAVDLADRVDRRQVDHVEAHRGDGLEPLRGGDQGAADDLAGLLLDVGALGAREELVPAGEERLRAVGEDGEGALGGEQVAQRVGGQHRAGARRCSAAARRASTGRVVSCSAFAASCTTAFSALVEPALRRSPARGPARPR